MGGIAAVLIALALVVRLLPEITAKECDAHTGIPIACTPKGSSDSWAITCDDVSLALEYYGEDGLRQRFYIVREDEVENAANALRICPTEEACDTSKWRGAIIPRKLSQSKRYIPIYDGTLYNEGPAGPERRFSWACSDTPREFQPRPDLLEWQYLETIDHEIAADVIVFTDAYLAMAHSFPNVKRKVALLLEPPNVYPESYRFVQAYGKHIFDAVLTFDARLVAQDPSLFIYYPHGGMCAKGSSGLIWKKKEKHISMIASAKNFTWGHRLRHAIVREFRSIIDVYGRGYGNEIKDRAQALEPYRYAIIVENSRVYGYHTEKLIECLAMGTIPIYWGSRSSHDMFNPQGMHFFSSLEELRALLHSGILGELDYKARFDAIKENMLRAQMHRVPEDFLVRHTDVFREAGAKVADPLYLSHLASPSERAPRAWQKH